MAALTKDRDTKRREGKWGEYKVKGSTKIFAGSEICLDAAGYAVPAANTAGLVYVGVSRDYVDNSAGSDGDLYARVWKGDRVEMTIVGAAITDVGRPVWIVDDQTVGFVKGHVLAGIISEYISATSVYVDVVPAVQARPIQTILSIPIKLANLADGDIVTEFTPGFAGSIVAYSFVVTDPATTAAKLSTLNLEIGTTDLTGGALALTSANCTPLGKVTDAAAITAANRFGAGDTISLEASSTTAFIEGEGVLLIVIA